MFELKPCPCCGRPMAADPISSNKGKKTPVVSISPDGTRTRYASLADAAKEIGGNIGLISRAVNFGKPYRGTMWVKDGGDDQG